MAEIVFRHLISALRIDASDKVRRKHFAAALNQAAECTDFMSMLALVSIINTAAQTATYLGSLIPAGD